MQKRLILLLLSFYFGSAHLQAQNWQLVWSDEFTNNISSDWVFETGTGSNGWGNNELQFYRQENATVEDGNLVINVKKENFGGRSYTSARMKTQGLKTFTYGKIEARIAIPSFTGAWPAFWMLGENITTVSWPACGEIDIMEYVNTSADLHGTIHWATPTYASYGQSTTVSNPTAFHTYTIIWDEEAITWYIDGVEYNSADIENNINSTEEFHRPFFLLLNVAVGGNWPGFTVNDDALPTTMKVDYVRVYEDLPSTFPTVSLAAPSNNATFTGPANVILNAIASTPTGTISKVEFFANEEKIGEVTASPYTLTWNNAPAGAHTITAVATNSELETTTSTEVNITVSNTTTSRTPGLNASDIMLYPNPSTNWVVVNVPSAMEGAYYRILDLNGREVVSSAELKEGFSVANLDAGIYSLVLSKDDIILIKKLIKAE
jgi:beta-glucanase (GH16 family)